IADDYSPDFVSVVDAVSGAYDGLSGDPVSQAQPGRKVVLVGVYQRAGKSRAVLVQDQLGIGEVREIDVRALVISSYPFRMKRVSQPGRECQLRRYAPLILEEKIEKRAALVLPEPVGYCAGESGAEQDVGEGGAAAQRLAVASIAAVKTESSWRVD